MRYIKDFMGLKICVKSTFIHVAHTIDTAEKQRRRSAPACTSISTMEPIPETTKTLPSSMMTSSCAVGHGERTEQSTELEWISSNDVVTLMIKNIPCSCRRADILAAIEEVGYKQVHDFFYVPTRRNKCLGYAFISFPVPQLAGEFARAMTGYQFSGSSSGKKVTIAPATLQGFKENLKHFKTTAVMHTDSKPLFKGRRAYDTFA
jgi:hypothetical protein